MHQGSKWLHNAADASFFNCSTHKTVNFPKGFQTYHDAKLTSRHWKHVAWLSREHRFWKKMKWYLLLPLFFCFMEKAKERPPRNLASYQATSRARYQGFSIFLSYSLDCNLVRDFDFFSQSSLFFSLLFIAFASPRSRVDICFDAVIVDGWLHPILYHFSSALLLAITKTSLVPFSPYGPNLLILLSLPSSFLSSSSWKMFNCSIYNEEKSNKEALKKILYKIPNRETGTRKTTWPKTHPF